MTMASSLSSTIQTIGADIKALQAGVPSGALTRPKNASIAIIGDSITNQCSGANGTETYGYLSNAIRQSGGRGWFDLANNYGVGGDTTTQIRVRTPNVVASGCGIVFLLGGTNDRTSGLTVDTTITNLKYMRDQFTAAGQFTICYVPMPRGDSRNSTTIAKRLTAAQLADHLLTRKRILNEMPTAMCIVIDTWPKFADLTSSTGDVISGYTHDGLHPSPTGAYIMGVLAGPVLARLLSDDQDLFPYGNSDVYSATNLWGCGNLNPMMLGTAGTPATGGSGQLADNWRGSTASTATGVTRTYSKVTDSAGKVWQQVDLGGAAPPSAGRLDVLQQQSLQASFVAGGVYELVGRYTVTAGAQFLLSIQPTIRVNGATVPLYDGDRYDADQYLPSPQAGVFKSPRVTIPAGATDIRTEVSCYVSNLGIPVASMQFTDVTARRVA